MLVVIFARGAVALGGYALAARKLAGARGLLLAWIACIALGLAALGLGLRVAVGDSTATRAWGCVLVLGLLAAGGRIVIPRVMHPVALRIDERGIDIGERGAVPWAAVDRVALWTVAGVRQLTFSLKGASG